MGNERRLNEDHTGIHSSYSPPGFARLLFSSFAGNLVLPLYSVFLPLLAYRLGASIFEVGLVGGSANAVYAFMPFILGRLYDRTRARKFFVSLAFLVLSIVSISYTVIPNPVALIVARLFEGIGWATLWPSVEVAVSSGPLTDAKKSLSIFNFTWSSAAAVGPLLGSFLIFAASLRDTFVITSLILIVTLSLNLYSLFFSKREPLQLPKQSIEPSSPVPAANKKYRGGLYVLCTSLAAVSSGIMYTFFSPYAESLNISIILIGFVVFMYGFARFLTYVFIARERVRRLLLSQGPRLKILFLSLVLMSLSSLLLFVRDSSVLTYVLAYALAGTGFSVVYSVSQAGLIAESSPHNIGRNAGLFECSIGIGQSIGPAFGGAIAGGSLVLPFITPPLSLVLLFVLLPLFLVRRS